MVRTLYLRTSLSSFWLCLFCLTVPAVGCGGSRGGKAQEEEHETCAETYGACTHDRDCGLDRVCREAVCVDEGVDGATPLCSSGCVQSVDIEEILPSEQCRWEGDPVVASTHNQVMVTPVVVDFQLDSDLDESTYAPSIVFPSFPTANYGTLPGYWAPSYLRIVDGGTCQTLFTLNGPGDEVEGVASVAVGDLDGDGRAEIVAAAFGDGLIAFRYDETMKEFVRYWHTNDPGYDGNGQANIWAGPSLYDLNDDGTPEILFHESVYDAQGNILDDVTLARGNYERGVIPVVADVDEDGAPEVVFNEGVFAWDEVNQELVRETYSPYAVTGGQVAVAEMGVFPVSSPVAGQDYPEIVVVRDELVYVKTIDGQVVFGPLPIPEGPVSNSNGNKGGAPTVADFDGDGRAEFATAGADRYVVFDLDCQDPVDLGNCASGSTDGILWVQASQDASSNMTGSSVFDFDADGAAEVVYADECYLRVYDGKTGEVRYSAPRSSGTAYDNPIIVDVDGDFRTEIVAAANDYGNLVCPSTDPLRNSTVFEESHGIVVLRDVEDRWAASRPVWNQHAYSVTHVGNRGETIRSSEVLRNWDVDGLNNFRQNVQGDVDALANADAAVLRPDSLFVPCADGMATMSAEVCNRGALPMGRGVVLAFRDDQNVEICRGQTSQSLSIGSCERVSCTGPMTETSMDVLAVADPDGVQSECLETNNEATMRVTCSSGVI